MGFWNTIDYRTLYYLLYTTLIKKLWQGSVFDFGSVTLNIFIKIKLKKIPDMKEGDFHEKMC